MNILKEVIKCFLSEPMWFMNLIKKKHISKKAILIGTPVHGNLGDHLIAEEEISFLSDYFKDYTVVEFCMPMYLVASRFIKNMSSPNDIIFVSGGGWMGNLWLDNEFTIRNIIKSFPDNQIVIFPQTAYYTDDTEGRRVMEETVNIIKNHKNILLMFRDYKSYSLMKKQVSSDRVRVGYYPDMALYGSFFDNGSISDLKNRQVFICLRDDREAKIDKSLVLKKIKESCYDVNLFTTVKNRRIYPRNRRKALLDMRNEIITADLIISDRLHAMIFSILNGIPCLAFDNKTGKISGVYEWIKDMKMVTLLNDSCANIENIDIKFSDKIHYSRNYLNLFYKNMAGDIRKGVIKVED